MKNVAIYARVSTHEQDPDMQLMALRDYAKKRDFNIFNEYIDVISAKAETRENYVRLTIKEKLSFRDLERQINTSSFEKSDDC